MKFKTLSPFSVFFKIVGRVRYDVLNSDGSIAHAKPFGCNLITDQGLDMVALYPFAQCFCFGNLGTGTAEPAYSDTKLGSWIKKLTIPGDGDCGYTIDGDTIILHRSWIGDEATESAVYTEFGSSPLYEDDPDIFNHILFDEPLVVNPGQVPKVYMDLSITVTPHTTEKVYSGAKISNVANSTGKSRIFCLDYQLRRSNYPYKHATVVATPAESGDVSATLTSDGKGCLEPSGVYGFKLFLSTHDELLDSSSSLLRGPDINLLGDIYRSSLAGTLGDYVAGSHSRTKTFVADLNDCNALNLRTLGIFGTVGWFDIYYVYHWQFLSDVSFDKLNTQRLTVNIHLGWGRGQAPSDPSDPGDPGDPGGDPGDPGDPDPSTWCTGILVHGTTNGNGQYVFSFTYQDCAGSMQTVSVTTDAAEMGYGMLVSANGPVSFHSNSGNSWSWISSNTPPSSGDSSSSDDGSATGQETQH